MKTIVILAKVAAAIPKVVEVLSLAHKLLDTLLGHLNGSAPAVTPPAQVAPPTE